MKSKEQMRCQYCRGYLSGIAGSEDLYCYGCQSFCDAKTGAPLKAARASRKPAEASVPPEAGVGALQPAGGVQTVTLAYPPGNNNFKVPHVASYGNRTTVTFRLSEKARAWKEDAQKCILAAGLHPVCGAVKVTIRIYRPRKRGDTDGSLKLPLDALVDAGVMQDDEQVVELHAYRYEDPARPRVEIQIEAVEA